MMTSTPTRRKRNLGRNHTNRCLRFRSWSRRRMSQARPTAPCSQRSWSRSALCRAARPADQGPQLRGRRDVYRHHRSHRVASTMVMVIPFSQRCEGWHGRSGSERRGSGLFAQPGPITPNSETGRAVFQCAAGRPRLTTCCNVTGLQVRPDRPALPKLFRTSNQAVDPQRSINVLGRSSQSAMWGTPEASPDTMWSMTDEKFIDLVVDACRQLSNAEAVSLGGSSGSRGLSSRQRLGLRGLLPGRHGFARLTNWVGRAMSSAPGEWGRSCTAVRCSTSTAGISTSTIGTCDVVEHWTDEASDGRFEVHILGFHLAGIPTYMLPGELAGGRTLWGDLPRPIYPDALRRTAPPFWLDRANRELDYAKYWASTANPINCAGSLAKTVLQGAHARLAHRGIWALNEKRMVGWAELNNLNERFSHLGSSDAELTAAIEDVRASIRAIETEVSPTP